MSTKDLIVVIFGSAGFFAFLQFIIQFIDNKRTDKKNHLERNVKRIELLLLIADYPDKREEIMEVAEDYFVKLKGNWFAHGIFRDWLEKNDIDRPEWFK